MNKDQYLGLLREALTAVGVLLVTLGFTSLSREAGPDGATVAQLGIGAILALVSLVWGIAVHEDADVIKTLTRKVLSSLAGFLVGVGWLSPEKANAIFGLLLTFLPIAWSIIDKGKVPKMPSGTSVFLALMAAAAALAFCACTVSFDPEGNPTVFVDPVAAAQIANDVAERINPSK